MERLFKIRASQCHRIMGDVGLTQLQEREYRELSDRHEHPDFLKPLTDKQYETLRYLGRKKYNVVLPETCTSYLKEWYAGDDEQIHSKYFDKGNIVENDLIDFMARVLGYGIAIKNTERITSDEYMEGECDVKLHDAVVDVKAPWNIETLQAQCQGIIDTGYEWQGRVYMHLYRRAMFILFFGLMDTPEDVNYGKEVLYSETLPEANRWVAYRITADQSFIDRIIIRVRQCRRWLVEYDKLINTHRGKINSFELQPVT